VWCAVGVVCGPLVATAGWAVRHASGRRRHLGVALIGAVVTGEGLYLGVALRYWGEAAVFVALGCALTAVLTRYRARAAGPRAWLPLVLMPAMAALFLVLETAVLGALLG
jgi:hypothetical protein